MNNRENKDKNKKVKVSVFYNNKPVCLSLQMFTLMGQHEDEEDKVRPSALSGQHDSEDEHHR